MSPRFTALAPLITTRLSTVVHAWDHETQSAVALKRPLPDQDSSAASLRRETCLLQCVQHPHLVKLIAHGSDELGPYLATEWHPGTSLEQWLEAPIVASEAASNVRRHQEQLTAFHILFHPILQAVAALHAAGFAHGDLTAANVMLDATPSLDPSSIRLIDMGNATRLPSAQPSASQAPTFGVGCSILDVECSTFNVRSSPHGSIFSMAPELFDNHAPDEKTDLYALGVMAYFMLADQLPFQGETKPQVIAAHCRHWRTPLETLRPDLPAALIQWVENLIAKLPQDRPPSIQLTLAALEKTSPPFPIHNS